MDFSSVIHFKDQFLSKYQCGFRKGYNTHTIIKYNQPDKGKSFGALLTYLRHFDCLTHKRLLEKIHAYGFSIAGFMLIHSYLTKGR